ncbi:MAG: family 43 glycosylhydrolase [Planctomycetaceae bacterium]|jgi:hypothetical protein|nr:family 43 glycosylhydrolase [Planctomycetaceae bacterium]
MKRTFFLLCCLIFIVPFSLSGYAADPPARDPLRTAIKVVIPTAVGKQVEWKYTHEAPSENWFRNDFDDSAWKTGKNGFGIGVPPGNPPVGTIWDTYNIWLRREFELDAKPEGTLYLLCYYDESPEIWINGVFAAKASGYTTSYVPLAIAPAAAATLKPGKNRFAVKASQTSGGQYIDVGLVREITLTDAEVADRKRELEERKKQTPAKMLFDYHVRDTCICRGPDGTWYLTGTTGHPDWWVTNEGIRIWKSNDLERWEPLGLVWSLEKDATWQKGVEINGKLHRAIWASELHYLKGTFWLTYCLNYGGTGLLKSTSGKAEGPYVDVKPDGPLTGEIDASLFQDDDGTVYFLWQDGKIAKMNEAMTAFVGEPKFLRAEEGRIGFEGIFLTKKDGRYVLIAADFNNDLGESTYDCMAAYSDRLEGPYTDFHLAIPGGGHNMIFHDGKGHWYSTFFGNDPLTVFKERPGLVPIHWDDRGRIRVTR